MLPLALLGLLVFLTVVQRLAAWSATRVPDDGPDPTPSPAVRAWRAAHARRTPRLPLLPLGHRPPVGLGPISPSERFLRSESARGLRELQTWLLEQRPA